MNIQEGLILSRSHPIQPVMKNARRRRPQCGVDTTCVYAVCLHVFTVYFRMFNTFSNLQFQVSAHRSKLPHFCPCDGFLFACDVTRQRLQSANWSLRWCKLLRRSISTSIKFPVCRRNNFLQTVLVCNLIQTV